MKTNRSANGSSASATHKRYLRRGRKPADLWPWGWLPLFGLVATFAYGLLVTTPEIQAHTVAQVTEQLKTDGIGVLDVSGSGQRVLVRAHVSMDKKSIRASVRSARCRTWLADVPCATGVDLDVVTTGGGSAVASASTAAAWTEGPPAKPHRFNFKTRDGIAVLRGEVPTEEARRSIVLEATTLFDEVSDRLVVSKDPPDEAFQWARERALKVLSALHSGQVIWQSGRMSVRGVASDRNQVIIRNALTDGADPRPGQITLQPLMTAEDCNEQFGSLLEGGALRFERGSSELQPDSGPILEQIAKIARDCRQPLVVGGHTDSRGRSQDNRALSQARAEAVKAALVASGIAGSRLVALGYGDEQPIADNGTETGRAANRRIEIRVKDEDEADSVEARASSADARQDPRQASTDRCGAQLEALLDQNALRFSRGASTLSADSATVLEQLAQLARDCRQPLMIAGHTDSRGQPQDNRDLSLARAESVKAALIARGVPASRLTARGYGDARPIANNATEEGRAANRRIEIQIAGDK